MKYQCDKTKEFVTPQWGWTHCPFCGAELKPRKYMIPEFHEVWNLDSVKTTAKVVGKAIIKPPPDVSN